MTVCLRRATCLSIVFLGVVMQAMADGSLARAAVQGPPQAALLLNQTHYSSGDRLVLTMSAQEGSENNQLDVYFWITTPDGGIFYLGSDGLYHASAIPVASNIVVPDAFGTIFDVVLPEDLPAGAYSFHLAGVLPGTPLSTENAAVAQTNQPLVKTSASMSFGGNAPFTLMSPVGGHTDPYQLGISAVLDHSGSKFFRTGRDSVVLAYSGEAGDHQCKGDKTPGCTNKAIAGLFEGFFVNGAYQDYGKYLYYDGHPGYDFAHIGNIVAAAEGVLSIPPTDPVDSHPTLTPQAAYNTIRVRHVGTGYETWYLHAQWGSVGAYDDKGNKTPIPPEGIEVRRGQKIGVIGNFGVDKAGEAGGGVHLHFEVRRGAPDGDCATANACKVVDPFGWEWIDQDPFERGLNPQAITNAHNLWGEQPPTLVRVTPWEIAVGQTVDLTVEGNKVLPGATLTLWHREGKYVLCPNLQEGCRFPLENVGTGLYRVTLPAIPVPGDYVVKIRNPGGPKSRPLPLRVVPNQPPVITSFTANPSAVSPGGTSTLSLTASDPENDPLTYSWTTSGGTLSTNTGPGPVTWRAPSTVGVYTVTVSVTDNKPGHTPVSASVNLTVQSGLPAAPSNLTATAVSSSQINLTWQDNSTNESGFKIERKTGSGAYSQIATVGANVTMYQDTGLTANTTYTYRVRATNSVGDSAWSNEASATPGAPNQPPVITGGSVDPLVVSPGGTSTLSVTASDPENDPLTYSWTTSGGTLSPTTGPGPVTWRAPSTVGVYTVTVSVTDNKPGHTPVSASVNLTVQSGLPVAPSNLTATVASSSQINLIWQDNASNELEFRIERKTGAGGTYSQIATVGANITSFQNTGLSANTTYVYRVRACNAAGCSGYSNEASATTSGSPPGSFTLTATPECSGTSPQIRLNWTTSSGATSYDVYRNGGLYYSNVTGTQFINTMVTSGTTYSYYVQAKNAYGATNSYTVWSTAPSNCGPVEVIVDDQGSGFSKYGTPSYWKEAWIGYNGHMYWTYNNQWTIDNYARWQPNLSSGGAGTYAVYIYIPNNYANTTNATYTVFHNGITDTRTVNQAIYYNQWVLVGSFYFSATGNEYVQLVDKTGETAITKMIGFDAVKWVKQ